MSKSKNSKSDKKKNADVGSNKPPKIGDVVGLAGKDGLSEHENGQAWERGESIPLAENETDPLLESED